MDVEGYIAALEHEGRTLVEAARCADPGAAVPTCPEWRVADLLGHIGYVHRWATRYVATALRETVAEPDEPTILKSAPPEAERCAWVAEGHSSLVQALRSAPSDLVCWTFLPAPSPLAMWARRQAHETAVHRVDAELGAGLAATPVDRILAADGIEELLFAFFGRPPRRRLQVPGGAVTIALGATGLPRVAGVDPPDGWTVRVTERVVSATRALEPGDVTVRGTASDLYLLLWHRRPIDGLEVDGPRELFDQVWGPRGVTWG